MNLGRYQLAIDVSDNVLSQDDIIDETDEELQRLINEWEFIWLFEEDHTIKIDKIRNIISQIQELLRDAKSASMVAGMVAPWKPSLNVKSGKSSREIQFSIPGDTLSEYYNSPSGKFRFPWIEEALEFLGNRRAVSHDEFKSLTSREKRIVAHVPQVNDVRVVKEVSAIIQDSVREGDDFRRFQKKVTDNIKAKKNELRTIFRTSVHQSFVEGQEEVMGKAVVSNAFPYIMLSTSRDNRVRDHHAAVHGFVVARSDPAYKVFRVLLQDWNCRCSPIPISRSRAELIGIKTYADIPREVIERYGARAA